jgi:FkbM family methyltransferase
MLVRNRPIQLDHLEALFLLLIIFAGAFVVGDHWTAQRFGDYRPPFDSASDEELDRTLRSRFGPQRHSNGPEEWIIRDYFQDRHNGVFLDVGAWHWQTGSNTFFLEHDLGWSGLAVDASSEFAEGWREHRRRSRFVIAFVDAIDEGSREFYAGANSQTSSGTRRQPEEFGGGVVGSRSVTTAKLDTLLDSARIGRIDLVSMDIEQAEPAALAGFSIARFRPALVCIEAHLPARTKILNYFAAAGYVVNAKYLRYDTQNLYFEPLPHVE